MDLTYYNHLFHAIINGNISTCSNYMYLITWVHVIDIEVSYGTRTGYCKNLICCHESAELALEIPIHQDYPWWFTFMSSRGWMIDLLAFCHYIIYTILNRRLDYKKLYWVRMTENKTIKNVLKPLVKVSLLSWLLSTLGMRLYLVSCPTVFWQGNL